MIANQHKDEHRLSGDLEGFLDKTNDADVGGRGREQGGEQGGWGGGGEEHSVPLSFELFNDDEPLSLEMSPPPSNKRSRK
jgi:hypothetical protein